MTQVPLAARTTPPSNCMKPLEVPFKTVAKSSNSYAQATHYCPRPRQAQAQAPSSFHFQKTDGGAEPIEQEGAGEDKDSCLLPNEGLCALLCGVRATEQEFGTAELHAQNRISVGGTNRHALILTPHLG